MPLVKAVQEQQDEIAILKAGLNETQAEQNGILARPGKLESKNPVRRSR